jgi:hypothetical protein
MANNSGQPNQNKLDDALQTIIRLKKKNNRLHDENLHLIKENSQLKRINEDLKVKIDNMVDIEEVND